MNNYIIFKIRAHTCIQNPFYETLPTGLVVDYFSRKQALQSLYVLVSHARPLPPPGERVR